MITYAMYAAGEVSDWVLRNELQAKFKGVIFKNVLRDRLYDASSAADQGHHELQLYQPIASAVYEPVNQAAKILGLPLRYTTSHGVLSKGRQIPTLAMWTSQTHSTLRFSSSLLCGSCTCTC